MSHLRVGILGASRIAPKAIIAPVKKRGDLQIVALACRDKGRGKTYAAEHGIGDTEIMDDYEALCARDDLDLIYNALPPSEHLRTAKAVSEHCMVHLIEKPFAMNATEAEKIVSESKARYTLEAFHHLYHPAFRLFLGAVSALGPLRHMSGRFHVPIPNRPGELRHIAELGGGGFMDLGTYMLHMARTIADREPKILSAKAIEGQPGIDLHITTKLDFGKGLSAHISSDMRETIEREIYFEVTGERGTARLDCPIHPYRGFTLSTPDGTLTLDDHPDWANITTYDAQLTAILNAIADGSDLPVGGRDAIDQMRAIDAIYESCRLGRRVARVC